MNCKKWEQKIYLYDDLSADEQKQLDDHILTCPACTVTMQTARQGMELALLARKVIAQAENPELLTGAILKEIRSGVKIKSSSIFSVIMDHAFTRYAFGTVSFLIIVFFIVEQNNSSEPTKLFMRMPRGAQSVVTLNSSSFAKNLRSEQSRKSNLKVFSLYSCAKQEGCDIAFVKNLKRKHKS